MIPRKQLPSEGKLLDSTTTPSHEHYIADHMMEFYFAAFHTEAQVVLREAHDGMCGAHQSKRKLGYLTAKTWLLLAKNDS